MPVSEQGFADRQQRGQTMQTAIAGFSPAFAPADASLAPAAFLTFVGQLDVLNTEVGTLATQYTNGVEQRAPMMADIQERAARVLEYVKSNSVWAEFVPGLKKYVDKIRGNRPATPKPPASGEAPGSAPAKKRSQGELSFGDIEENFERLIAALASVPGYAPPATELTIANLTTLATTFATKNLTMATLGNSLIMKQAARLKAFDGPGGLKDKMKAIKSAVRSQYGTDSAEYESVKGIGL